MASLRLLEFGITVNISRDQISYDVFRFISFAILNLASRKEHKKIKKKKKKKKKKYWITIDKQV